MRLKKISFLLATVAFTGLLSAEPYKPNSYESKVSYLLGKSVGDQFRLQLLDIKLEDFIKGFEDAKNNAESALSDDESQEVLQKFEKEQIAKRKAAIEKQAAANLTLSNEFLEKNKKNPKVVTTKSGLQYEIITKGQGKSPLATDKVKVHYKGTLIDGKEFDSSYKRGKPVEFAVNRVIAGWTEALQLMKPGSKWKLYIAPDLAYGAHGQGGIIEPNSTLIFDVELLEVVKN